MELTTVADDEAVVHDGTLVRTYDGLSPDTDHDLDGFAFRTLPAPGERLATFTTVNDVHFGEEVCGVIEGSDLGPTFRSEPGADPYPEVMNRGAVADMAAVAPDAVLVKGDLTNVGSREEYDRFLEVYGGAFGDRLHHVRGNHDAYRGEDFAADAPFLVELPGVALAVLDTTLPLRTPGGLSDEQLEWLGDVAADSDRPVMVFGHHHVWDPTSGVRPDDYFGINPDDSERLIDVVAAHPSIVAYSAGHTHRNRVRRFPATGGVPWAEVACVKDFPGTWAEYRVFEGGILAIHRRISSPEALAWSERTRAMYGGAYFEYAFGDLDERCYPIWPRSG
ncbi:MAG: metallophosphoesterase [Acidimicrobiales bacterium]|nr:metallophosphoesterase [Acidimicrobiales bacterium]MCB9373569.1 metallophosphoesterase [Microthrixaceae bacterium]